MIYVIIKPCSNGWTSLTPAQNNHHLTSMLDLIDSNSSMIFLLDSAHFSWERKKHQPQIRQKVLVRFPSLTLRSLSSLLHQVISQSLPLSATTRCPALPRIRRSPAGRPPPPPPPGPDRRPRCTPGTSPASPRHNCRPDAPRFSLAPAKVLSGCARLFIFRD